ncbi:MAG: uracil-DNA glycosylase family protein [Spirochaetaceae bacterium]
MTLLAREILRAGERLSREAGELSFSVPYVYNSFSYAWDGWRRYVERWLGTPKEALFLGMNPGPWGMAQTGVPFGEVATVRNWLRIEPEIRKPRREHPKRPILGMSCPRSEVSGRRLWGLFAEQFGTPERFFERFGVVNYCPLVFMAETGRNITPDKLRRQEQKPLFDLCDSHLLRLIELLEPELCIGVGRFAEGMLQGRAGDRREVRRILHPSPASPAANRDWAGRVREELSDIL